MILTPKATSSNFDKEINHHSGRIRKAKERYNLKDKLRRPFNDSKHHTSIEFWRKRSMSKPNQKMETEKKHREDVLINSALFLRNKNHLEEALGGDENKLYRKSIYGLFQLGKDFQAKYAYQEKV